MKRPPDPGRRMLPRFVTASGKTPPAVREPQLWSRCAMYEGGVVRRGPPARVSLMTPKGPRRERPDAARRYRFLEHAGDPGSCPFREAIGRGSGRRRIWRATALRAWAPRSRPAAHRHYDDGLLVVVVAEGRTRRTTHSRMLNRCCIGRFRRPLRHRRAWVSGKKALETHRRVCAPG